MQSWEYDEPASRDAVLALEETGDRKFDRYVGTRRRGDLYEGATVLDVMVRQLRSKELLLSSFNWWYARHCSGTRNRVWKEYPHIWFGDRTLPDTGPPFDAPDQRFRRALTQVFNDVGMEKLQVKPSRRFLEALARSYRNISSRPNSGDSGA